MNKKNGFTLVEAAVVTGVVFILSGIIVPMVLRYLDDARVARAHNDINVIAGAMAQQLKTLGRRPMFNTDGANAGNATGDAIWYSGGVAPAIGANPAGGAGAPAAGPGPAIGNQTFMNLFHATAVNGQTLFGAPGNGPHSYQGPFLPLGAAPTDPWGRAYVILGYNANGQAANGPIWIVCAGPRGTIARANLQVLAGNVYTNLWDFTQDSEGNIAVRIN